MLLSPARSALRVEVVFVQLDGWHGCANDGVRAIWLMLLLRGEAAQSKGFLGVTWLLARRRAVVVGLTCGAQDVDETWKA